MVVTKITIDDIRKQIELHHEENPSHGYNCSCMDKYIRSARTLLTAENKDAQMRIDYVILKAIQNR